MNDEHSHEEMLLRLANLEEQLDRLAEWAEQHQRGSLDSALQRLGPDALSPAAQAQLERLMGFKP